MRDWIKSPQGDSDLISGIFMCVESARARSLPGELCYGRMYILPINRQGGRRELLT